ncbi:MAG: hypothetical protein RI965_914 [Bacteroidota bacterium]|jgi:hypothetical protein
MKKLFLFIFFIAVCCSSTKIFSQSNISGTIKGLKSGDTAIVSIQKSSEQFFFKKLGGNSTSSDLLFEFKNIPNGKWALSIDSKGYLFPTAKVIELNNNTIDNIITLTKAPSDSNFSYQWQDDSSYVGHSQQSYINDKVEIQILGKAEKIPDNFNAVNILNQYGFYLSNEDATWTSEETYRLYQTLKKLDFAKYSENDSVKVKAKWSITDKFIDKDIDISKKDGIDIIKISRAAFTYASPLVVTVDGVKGKFYSKRLFNAIVFYYTDKGTNKNLIDQIAKSRYGFEFLTPSSFLKSLMNETESNFQEFSTEEKLIILSMFEEFPDAMQRQDKLKYMVRRINGQKHPLYDLAPAIAWVQNQNIEWMESAFKDQGIEYMQRLVLHEKAHFLWEHIFDQTTKDDWAQAGGWFKDPTSATGWTTSNTTEFVSAYAHLKNPNEDMAESIAFYITNPEALRSRSLKKFEFIRDRIMKGTRYISVIRPDLTFTVYNLYPDYNYPGKIKRTKLEVFGKENEDKKIVFEIELTIMNKAFDGATAAQCRFTSSIGTIQDMWLYPVSGTNGSILRGEVTLSKFAKSGYWIIPQVVIWDAVGNKRLENNSTYGVKCFINNPLEDVIAPLYIQGSLKLDSTTQKFTQFTGATNSSGDLMQAMRIRFSFIEKNTINPNGRVLARIFMPTIDSTDKYNLQPYSKDVQINGPGILNDYPDSTKSCDFYFPIPDYFPSGYYSMNYLAMGDVALNGRAVLFDLDTSNKNYFIAPKYINQRAIRDSMYFKTKYPDYKPPVLDINDIKIQATPTNPISPNGETLFEIWLWIKDESDFPGKASGFSNGEFTLRDPQGLEHQFFESIFDNNYFYSVIPDSSVYGYKRYYAKVLLPAGSPPGLWGLSSITLWDKARNKKYYNFVEIVRFDVEQSSVLQVTPYVEILGKKVNSQNVDSTNVILGCKSCKDQNYRLRMYSSMGGNSVVYEGKMTSDTIKLSNLKLTGVNDGILYATVFILDSSKALIGTGKATYTKDTKIPNSQKLQTNLSNFGKSNLDSLIIDIQSSELNGSYKVVLYQTTVKNTLNNLSTSELKLEANFTQNYLSVGDSIAINGTYTNGNFKIDGSSLKNMQDGIITLKFYFYDSVGNPGDPIIKTLYKDTKNPETSVIKQSSSGLKFIYSFNATEYLSNTLQKNSISVLNGSIDSLSQISNSKYLIYLTKSCNDTTGILLKSGALIDTVGNKNGEVTFTFTDSIVPKSPIVSDLNICQGATGSQLTASVSNNATLLWYGSNATGGTSTNIAPTINTSSPGIVNYFVSQKNNNTGCESMRSKIIVTTKELPLSPIISRDTDNNLVVNTNGITWYKDGVKISDTAQKIKPISNGNYTATTTQNGCISPASANYYYLVSAVANFSGDEFFKISPNPTNGEVYLNYNIRSTRDLYINVFDMNGKVIIRNKKITSGIKLSLIGSPKGNYFIQVKEKSGKLITTEKLIKN